jgi:hypothetical protein
VGDAGTPVQREAGTRSTSRGSGQSAIFLQKNLLFLFLLFFCRGLQ